MEQTNNNLDKRERETKKEEENVAPLHGNHSETLVSGTCTHDAPTAPSRKSIHPTHPHTCTLAASFTAMLFTPKHQKLILQCYPSGRGADKKPNSSELSYLLYYASTRRMKLEKVGRFLQKKNTTDVARSRPGNVQVTLEIVDALMKKCPDDVNVFAGNINAILLSVLTTDDLALCEHALPVYSTLCKTLDAELFTGDFEFIDSFSKVTRQFFSLAVKAHAANPVEWRSISFRAVDSFASSKLLITGKGRSMAEYAIPLVLNEIKDDFSADNLIKRTMSHSSSQHDLSRFNTARTSRFDEVPEQKETKNDDLAMAALKSFFSTNSATQINISTRAVSSYLISTKTTNQWGAAIVQMISQWIPVQLRFLVLTILMGQLKNETEMDSQVNILNVISELLSSSVNLIGLSVIDHLRQLLDLQVQFVNSGKAYPQLIEGYSNTIGSLAMHIYYRDQIIDMIGELSVNLKEYYKAHQSSGILVLLDNIKRVLVTANNHSALQRTKVPLEIFAETFGLLSFNDNAFTGGVNFNIQMKYADVLNTLLELEYDGDKTIKADYDNLITNAKSSVINRLYEAIEPTCKFVTTVSFTAITKLIDLVSEKFGVNAIVNALPFFFEWQLKDENTNDTSLMLKDNLGLYIVYATSKTLKLDELKDQILSGVDYRKSKLLWRISDVLPSEQSTLTPKFQLTKEELGPFAEVTAMLQGYQETMFSTHYRYQNLVSNVEITFDDGDATSQNGIQQGQDPEASFMSQNGSQNISLSMLPQSQQYFSGNESGSIRSAPLSARSLMMGKLNIPKVSQLRNAISGTGDRTTSLNGQGRDYGTGASARKTDAATLLNDLSFNTELDDRGTLSVRR